MNHVAISAPRVVTADAVLAPGTVVVTEGRISDVRGGRPSGPHVRLDRGVLAPGLVDLQVNGWAGHDFADADDAGWRAAADALAREGVTAFLPTLVTAPVERLATRLRETAALRARLAAEGEGARPVGVHVEGPFLSPAHPGAHEPAWLCDPTPERVEALLAADPGAIRVLTLAPERDGALDAIRRLADAGVVVSVGHSDATSAQVAAAARAGARMVTHLFNAQRGLHHREPGVAGAALDDARLTVGLIADGEHVAPAACRIAFAAAAGRIALVSDAAAAGGMPPGRYTLGGQEIVLDAEGPPRRADGTIAGAALSLSAAVASAVRMGIGERAAIDAATRIPADAIGRADLGRIAPGARADLAWLSDELAPLATWIGGRLVHGEI